MARTKVTKRRQLLEWLLRRGRRTEPYKIKLTLPEQKQVDIKKNGQVIKTIKVRHKSKYVRTRSARSFLLSLYEINFLS